MDSFNRRSSKGASLASMYRLEIGLVLLTGAKCTKCQSEPSVVDAVQLSQIGLGSCAIHNAAIVQLRADNGSVQHQEGVPVSSPLQVCYHSHQIECLLTLSFQHTDVLPER